MASNLDIDEELLEQALKVGGHRTKKATVTEALREYIQRRKQLEVLDLVGKIGYYDDYEPKKYRKRQS